MQSLLTIKTLCEHYQAGERFKYIFFWGHTESSPKIVSKSCFSQWYQSPFTIDGVCYLTAEHYMMAGKARLFNDEQTLQKIIESKDPGAVKALGRQVQGFKQDIWEKNCSQIVIAGNLAKFSQNPELKAFLLKTGDKILVEASPSDRIWGIGLAENAENIENPLTWKGQNLLGFALMVVREQLKQL